MGQPGPHTLAAQDTMKAVPPPAPIQVGSNGAPGGYKFEPDQVQSVIGKWKQLLADLKTDESKARQVAYVRAPGKEFASGDFVGVANPSGKTLLEQNQRMIEYVQNYIGALEKASGHIQQSEDDARQQAAQQGKQIV
jgi:hypothetical protein